MRQHQHHMNKRLWVTAIAACGVAIAFLGGARADLIAFDDFEDAEVGLLAGQSSGTGFTGDYSALDYIEVVEHSLSYASGEISIDGGTKCLRMADSGTSGDSPVLHRPIGTQDADTLYMSFLFQTTEDTATGGSDEDFFFIGFCNTTKEPRAGVIHRLNAASSAHDFGLRGTSGSNEQKGSGSTVAGQTYFVVLKVEKSEPGASSNYDRLALFVNPSTTHEPGTPDMTYNTTMFSAATHFTARIALIETGDTFYVGNPRMGTTYASVVTDQKVVRSPTFTPDGGQFSGSVEVMIESETEGASFRYTLDGSDPTPTEGTLYTGPFSLSAATQVRAIAYKTGMLDSSVSVADFLVTMDWLGEGEDDNWSTAANWTSAGSPAGADLTFGNTNRTSASVVNNIVDVDYTVSSLSFTNSTLVAGVSWHVTEIGTGRTLTIDGSTDPEYGVLVGGIYASRTFTTSVEMKGGGSLIVDAPESIFQISNRSSNETALGNLNLSGLSSFTADVDLFWCGRGDRSRGILTMPSTGDGIGLIRSTYIGVGDIDRIGDPGGSGLSEMRLGLASALHADRIAVAGSRPGRMNTQSGLMSFQEGLTDPSVAFRGHEGGESRCDLVIGSHGSGQNNNTRSFSGNVDLTGGTVDARFGTLLLADARGRRWSNQRGEVNGSFIMDAGQVDVETVILGRTSNDNRSAHHATGTLTVSGGTFVSDTLRMAETLSNSRQSPVGVVNILNTGAVEVLGNLVMGTHLGTAPGVTSRVDVVGGTLAVGGNMAPGTEAPEVFSEVLLNGGALSVTNAGGDGTLRIENGIFGIASGTATLDRLVTSNELTTTRVGLRGTDVGDYGLVTVNDEVSLGGTLVVEFEEGYEPTGGSAWIIVGGTGSRTGTFDATDMPEGLKVVYTAYGYQLVYPATGTMLMLR